MADQHGFLLKWLWIFIICMLINDPAFARHYSDTLSKRPDSTWIVQTNIPGLEVHQVFYGSGYGNGIHILLFRKNQDVLECTDSIFCIWESDLFVPERISYDTLNQWITYTEQGGGTGSYSELKHIVEIKNNAFHELLRYIRYTSMIYLELARPFRYHVVSMQETTSNRTETILNVTYRKGLLIFWKSIPYKSAKGTLIYQFKPETDQFELTTITGRRLSRLINREPSVFFM
jgi:hypothetical protein